MDIKVLKVKKTPTTDRYLEQRIILKDKSRNSYQTKTVIDIVRDKNGSDFISFQTLFLAKDCKDFKHEKMLKRYKGYELYFSSQAYRVETMNLIVSLLLRNGIILNNK